MSKVLTILAPGFEETEAVSVIDLLRRAGVQVTVCGLNDIHITGAHEITIMCDTRLEDLSTDDYDCLFLPGGQPGTNNLKGDRRIIDMVQHYHKKQKLIAAICAAPTVLHAAGILVGKKVTGYPSEKHSLIGSIYQEKNVVQDGNIITSRGVGTSLEFALYLIGILKSEEVKKMHAARILF